VDTKVETAQPLHDVAIWSAVPSLAWVLLVAVLFWWLRPELKALLVAFVSRLKSGGAVRIGNFFEFGASSGLMALPGADFTTENAHQKVYVDKKEEFSNVRNALYSDAHNIMLVHRLQRSVNDSQLYDILIYLVPHSGSSLAGVTKVEYFFGRYWGNKVFPCTDRSRGFPVVTSAYGTFLCIARVHFNDETTTMLSRYIDFEMGALTPPRAPT
jgi:hypothetical protein